MTPVAATIVVSAERKRAFVEALARVVARRALREIENQKCDGPAGTGPIAKEREDVCEVECNVAP